MTTTSSTISHRETGTDTVGGAGVEGVRLLCEEAGGIGGPGCTGTQL